MYRNPFLSALILMLFFFTFSLDAQENTKNENKDCQNECEACEVDSHKQFIIDFKNKKIEHKPKCLKAGEFFNVKIESINLNLYNVIINSKDTLTQKPLDPPTFSSFDISGIVELVDNIRESIDVTNEGDGEEGVDSKVVSKYDSLYRSITHLKNRINTFFNEIEKIKSSLIFPEVFGGSDVDKKVTLSFSDRAQKLYEEISRNKSIVNEFIKTESNESVIKKLDSLSTILDSLQSRLEPSKIFKLLKEVALASYNYNKSYESLPIQYNGEQKEINLTIRPKDSNSLLQSYSTSFLFPERSRFYSTVGISFFGSSLFNKSYSTKDTIVSDTIINYQVIEEETPIGEFGIASVFRIGYKFYEQVGFHLNFGPGITVSDVVRPRMLLGVGFSFGEDHNFSIDGGLIVGYVDRLSKSIDLTGTLIQKPENVTVSNLDFGAYFSVGYHFRY